MNTHKLTVIKTLKISKCMQQQNSIPSLIVNNPTSKKSIKTNCNKCFENVA